MTLNACIRHQKDKKAVCLPWEECSFLHCEYCGRDGCEIADGIVVCDRCEIILDKHIKLSTGELTAPELKAMFQDKPSMKATREVYRE